MHNRKIEFSAVIARPVPNPALAISRMFYLSVSAFTAAASSGEITIPQKPQMR